MTPEYFQKMKLVLEYIILPLFLIPLLAIATKIFNLSMLILILFLIVAVALEVIANLKDNDKLKKISRISLSTFGLVFFTIYMAYY